MRCLYLFFVGLVDPVKTTFLRPLPQLINTTLLTTPQQLLITYVYKSIVITRKIPKFVLR